MSRIFWGVRGTVVLITFNNNTSRFSYAFFNNWSDKMEHCIHLAVTLSLIESEVRQFVFRQALTLMFDCFGYSYPYCYILCYKFISYYKQKLTKLTFQFSQTQKSWKVLAITYQVIKNYALKRHRFDGYWCISTPSHISKTYIEFLDKFDMCFFQV